MCQGSFNILHGTLPINIETKQKLKRFRTKRHDLFSTKHSSKQKFIILKQTDGL